MLLLIACACPDPVLAEPPPPAAEELRGLWITRWGWSSQGELSDLLEQASEAGVNAVYFQVRGTFDAYYLGGLEPVAARLDGSWDPLAFVVEQGHARDMQVHAWLNTFPLWRGTSAPPADHPAAQHPDWWLQKGGQPMAQSSGYVFADPANPQVRAHIVAVAEDLEARYALDGLHLDYVRYPDPDFDGASAGHVTRTVEAVQQGLDIPLSAAVWGVHTNRWGWSGVSQGGADYLQDSHAWLQQGLLDAAMPMIYWPTTDPAGERLDFATLAADHVERAGGQPIYTGIDTEHLSQDQIAACILASREAGAAGFVLFESRHALPLLGALPLEP
jgi:uncharacterized lipoprotein YddW (UPF0748 family)